MEDVRKAFDAFAEEYDKQREYVIPEMQQFYYTAIWAAESPHLPPKILDIGAGTGLLSAFMLQKFPDAAITLMDFSEQMLNVARQRFADRNNIAYVESDYTGSLPDETYDSICSALSIHHLAPEQKSQLFSKIFHSLTPGGMLVNADQADGETWYFRERYLTYWNEFLIAGPLGEQERGDILTRRDRLDQNEKPSLQLIWLSDAGFRC